MAKKTDYYKQLGDKVAKLRKKANISQTKMAQLIGIDRALISRFEKQGEKLPAERINDMLDILGFELGVVEKKKPLDAVTVKERLQQLLNAAEDVVARMNHDAKIKPLRSPAAGQAEQEHQQGCES